MQSSIALIITTRCNFKCKHCLREYYSKHHDLSLDLLENVLIESKKLGFKHIGITGGEPILHPNFNLLIDLICKYNFSWSITSNAALYQKYDSPIEAHKDKLKSIRFSLDGGTEETHDYVRQKGSYKKVIAATRYYQSKGVNVVLGLTVNSRNISEVSQFVKLAIDLGIKAIGFGAIIPTGYNLSLQPTWEQKKEVYNYIQKIRKELDIKIATTSSLYAPTAADKFCKNLNEHKPAINPLGDYIFCCDTIGQGAIIGSLNKESFTDLFKKGEKKAKDLIDKRRKMILNKSFFKGFNSCHFCNILLENQVKKQKKYGNENRVIIENRKKTETIEDKLI